MGVLRPTIYLVAGPNGAGKSSAAPYLLAPHVPLERYVNPDEIATALNPGDPYSVRRAAGANALQRVRAFELARLDFALETTLSGKWTTRLLRRLLADGYAADLSFLWLPDADAAVARVRYRVERQHGHRVPEEDVRRRFVRGLINFDLLRRTVTRWRVVDRRDAHSRPTIAEGAGDQMVVHDPLTWRGVTTSIRAAQDAQPTGQTGRGEGS